MTHVSNDSTGGDKTGECERSPIDRALLIEE